MDFEIVDPIEDVETIAAVRGIRELARLRRAYGGTRWRKRKGVAKIRLVMGETVRAEIHWYEGHGVGSKEYKIKRFLE